MVRIPVIVSLLICSWTSTTAQSKPPKPPLELTAAIVSQSYCSINPEAASLLLTVKVRYRNLGTERLILYKGHDLFFQTRIRSAVGNPAGPYEVWVLNSRYFDEEFEPIEQDSPGKVFLTLAPGSVYEREIMVGVPLMNSNAVRGDSAIYAGEHTLQLNVSTWYKSRALGQKLRQQWQRKGLLWIDGLVSAPVRFAARRPDSIPPCVSVIQSIV
ncbi:MAG: hypothetical protein AABM67_08730 [Acidobacteriota bacterium]